MQVKDFIAVWTVLSCYSSRFSHFSFFFLDSFFQFVVGVKIGFIWPIATKNNCPSSPSFFVTEWGLSVRLADWLTVCLSDWLTVCLSIKWTDWPADWLSVCAWLKEWLTDWLCLSNWLTDWLPVCLSERPDWSTNRPNDCLSVSMSQGVNDWLTDWLTNWLTLCESMSTSCTASIVLLNSCSSSSCCLRWIVCSDRCLNEDWSSSRIKSYVVEQKTHHLLL